MCVTCVHVHEVLEENIAERLFGNSGGRELDDKTEGAHSDCATLPSKLKEEPDEEERYVLVSAPSLTD